MISISRFSVSSLQFAALALLAVASTDSIAVPYDPGIGPIVLGGLVALLAFGLWVFVVVGGWKGVAIYAVLVLTAISWLNIRARGESKQRDEAAKQAHAWISERCLNDAGEFGTRPIHFPKKVFVRLNPADLYAGRGAEPIRKRTILENVTFVDAFPNPRPVDAAYIEITLVQETLPNAENFPLRGISTVITSADATVVARRIDISRDRGWCLSNANIAAATERFLLNWIGTKIGLDTGQSEKIVRVPNWSPMGSATPLSSGRFAERLRRRAFDLDEAIPGITHLLKKTNCIVVSSEWNRGGAGQAICGKDTDHENSVNLADVLATYELPDGWLSVSRTMADVILFDSLDVAERSKNGALRATWRLRFPGLNMNDIHEEPMSATNMRLDGSKLSVDVLFSRQTQTQTQLGAASNPAHLEWYSRMTTVSADLHRQ